MEKKSSNLKDKVNPQFGQIKKDVSRRKQFLEGPANGMEDESRKRRFENNGKTKLNREEEAI